MFKGLIRVALKNLKKRIFSQFQPLVDIEIIGMKSTKEKMHRNVLKQKYKYVKQSQNCLRHFFSSESYLSNAIQRKSIAISLHKIQIIIKPAIEKIIDLFLQNLIIEHV